jgi:hypothetical protein
VEPLFAEARPQTDVQPVAVSVAAPHHDPRKRRVECHRQRHIERDRVAMAGLAGTRGVRY